MTVIALVPSSSSQLLVAAAMAATATAAATAAAAAAPTPSTLTLHHQYQRRWDSYGNSETPKFKKRPRDLEADPLTGGVLCGFGVSA